MNLNDETTALGEDILKLLGEINREEMMHFDYVSDNLWSITNQLAARVETADDAVKQEVTDYLYYKIDPEKPVKSVLFYSVIMYITDSHEDVVNFVSYIRSNPYLSVNEKFFLHYQIKSVLFRKFKEGSVRTAAEQWMLFRDIVEEYKTDFYDKYEYIREEDRNRDFVIVIIGQILSIEHGPTKTALDRCNTLIEKLGKKVLLINTAEVLSSVGELPYVGCMVGNYEESFSDWKFIEWKGYRIPFFQCDHDTPNSFSIDMIMNMVQEKKPEFVINIGGSSVVASLVNMQVPVFSVGLGPSGIDSIEVAYQTLGRKINDFDRELLRCVGKSEAHVIEGEFTYTMVEQKKHLTKEELGLPEDSFVICVIGMRLDQEASDEFMQMLDRTLTDKMWVVFAGIFSSEDRVKKYDNLYSRFRFVGMQSDIQAFLDNCDLSLNPRRSGGGGGGGVEPMYKSVPVITPRFGDVYALVGDDFAVEDYDEMSDLIRKYYEDRDFYDSMSKKAKERADILTDSNEGFVNILKEAAKREHLTL